MGGWKNDLFEGWGKLTFGEDGAFYEGNQYITSTIMANIKICQTNYQKLVKMEVWGPLGQLLEAFGPQDDPKVKKPQKSKFEDLPQGPSLGTKI